MWPLNDGNDDSLTVFGTPFFQTKQEMRSTAINGVKYGVKYRGSTSVSDIRVYPEVISNQTRQLEIP